MPYSATQDLRGKHPSNTFTSLLTVNTSSNVVYDGAGNSIDSLNVSASWAPNLFLDIIDDVDTSTVTIAGNLSVTSAITNNTGDITINATYPDSQIVIGQGLNDSNTLTIDSITESFTFDSVNGSVIVNCPFTSNSDTTINNTLNVVSGYIGYNTTTPAAPLDFGIMSTGGKPFWLMYNDNAGINMGVWRDTPSPNITGFITNNGGSFSWGNSSTAAIPAFNAEWMRLTNGGNLGIGVTPSARLHTVSTTEQLRIGYNTSNYLTETVNSTGTITYNLSGSSPVFKFNQTITGSGLIAAQYIQLPISASGKVLTPTVATGSMYVNATNNLFYVYNGTAWRSASLN